MSVASVILTCSMLVGCDRSSPTAPDAPSAPPRVTVVFSGEQQLVAHEQAIRNIIVGTADRVATVLPLHMVQFTVFLDRARSIPGWGLGGYTSSPNDIEIVIDPEEPAIADLLASNLPPIVAHELHHAVRLAGVGYPENLLGSLVLEGLADQFAVGLLGIGPLPWNRAFGPSETDFYWALAEPELDSASFDFDVWFFRGNAELPPWAGYTLGFHIVGEYIDRHGGSGASLVFEPAESFRR